MAEKYVSGKRRKNLYRRRRRRQKRKMKTFLLGFIILATAVMAVNIIWRADLAKGESADPAKGKSAEPQSSGTDVSWRLTLVNGQNPIPEDYEPELVEVQGGEQVDVRIYDSLKRMLEDARAANWYQLPQVVSGYRTAGKQQSLFDEKVAEYKQEGYEESEAKELAKQWTAVPGHSEHQLGIAVDINGVTYDVYSWLMENSYKYGFIFRYPGDKTQITGVAEEVWHYRYVGVEAATEMYEQGICLEEYLEKTDQKVY